MSEHINAVGVQVSDIRPWITRDVEKFQQCGIDQMLKLLLLDCSDKSSKSVSETYRTYKTRLFERCLDKVLPICNGENKTPVDGMNGKLHQVKEALGTYSEIQTEKELYPVFVQAANTALLFLEKLEIEDIRSVEGPAVYFHVNDSMAIIQKHQDHASHRRPDVIVSDKDVCNREGLPGDIYIQNERLLELAKDPPRDTFEWSGVRTFVEFKKAKKEMERPPERYYSQKYTPPKDKYLTLDVLSKPDLDALPEVLVASEVGPRSPPPEPVRRSCQTMTPATLSSDSNTRKRSSDHLEPSGSQSKRAKPAHQKENSPIVQAGYYAAEMFTAHTTRLHVIGLIVVGDVLYFWRYDRQGTIQCSGFNFIQDLPRFLVLLLVMQRFREQDWGLNPDVDPKFGPRPESHETVLSDENGEKIEFALEPSDRERALHYGLNGRAMNMFSVKCKSLSDKDDLVVKVLWAEVARTSEPDILQRVYSISKDDDDIKLHVPDMLWSKVFKDTSTAKVRRRLGLMTEGARVLSMIIFRTLRQITELTESDILQAWWETVRCHLALWKLRVYHRDITPSKLKYYKVEEKIVGVLNDFDLASTQETASGTERTGTVPFMSVKHLKDPTLQGNVRHAYEHDAESFSWVLMWISLRYNDGTLCKKGGRPLDRLLRCSAAMCGEKRNDILNSLDYKTRYPKSGKGHDENLELAIVCIRGWQMKLERSSR